mmetsp:Transcript_33467/g.51394  ORF Transcript_33467/g.51394 Transcript_33467/m.51394 type:complete len:94 (-) Transcript_33467:399-680(-)
MIPDSTGLLVIFLLELGHYLVLLLAALPRPGVGSEVADSIYVWFSTPLPASLSCKIRQIITDGDVIDRSMRSPLIREHLRLPQFSFLLLCRLH